MNDATQRLSVRLATMAALVVLMLVGGTAFGEGASAGSDGQRLVGLLDYIGADYAGAVQHGEVIDKFEYKEMHALAEDARALAKGADQAPPELMATVHRLESLIDQKAAPTRVGTAARQVRKVVVEFFDVPLAPAQPPDLTAGETLYAANCTSCHGKDGAAEVAGTEDWDPPPAKFTDPEVRSALSPYRVFNTTTFGVEGTYMRAFSGLSATQRWDIAFYVMSLAHGHDTSGSADQLPGQFSPRLKTLASLSDQQVRTRLQEAGADAGDLDALVSYLRVEAPRKLQSTTNTSVAKTVELIEQARTSFDNGHLQQARKQVLSAYLEGYEPVESKLSALDDQLVQETENDFLALRNTLESEQVGQADAKFVALRASLSRAKQVLDQDEAQSWTAGLASSVIILREGLEIILLIGLLLGVLGRIKADKARIYVHAGWAAALVAGGLTWFAASGLITITGAGREVIEGAVGLLAAAVLFTVSFWFLSNLQSKKWMGFIREKIAQKAENGHLFALFGLAFLAVYREAFETILFYQALLLEADGSQGSVLVGLVGGAVVLAGVGYLIMKVGKKLPIKPFFAASGVLLYGLCVVVAGSGLHAFIEAGYLPVHSLSLPTVPLLGFYPELITVTVQGLLVVAAAVWGIFVFRGIEAKPAH